MNQTPIKAIRLKCLDCMCNQVNEVRLCPSKDCSLYPYRLGHNPAIKKRELSEDQKQAARERMQRLNSTKKTRL